MNEKLQSQFSHRQYMLARDYEVYYYNDYSLSKVQNHTHDYYEFYIFLEGNVSIEIGGKLYPLNSSDVVLIPPGIEHHAVIHDVKKDYRRFVVWISREYYQALQEKSSAYGYLMQYVAEKKEYIFHNDVITFNEIQSKVLQLLEEVHTDRYGKEAKISLCMDDLILHLNRIVYEQNTTRRYKGEQSLYQNLVQYIGEHLEEDLTLEKLAKVFFVSKYHIAHIFKENIGLSVHMYITKKRLQACRDAIINHATISEVYLLYGFRDYSSFYRAFKKEFGVSPKEYKQKERKVWGSIV